MIQLLPDFLNEIQTVLKEDFQKFLDSYNTAPYRGLRVNTLKTSMDDLKRILGFEWSQIPFSPFGTYIPENVDSLGNSPLHHCGAFYIQEPSAMSAVTLLSPKEGDLVLDLCAAPGGKSTQIGMLLNGKGLLWSNEIVKSRASVLLSNIERMGIRNAVVSCESPETLCKKLRGCFDKVLVDAPCSGEGMFRKEPQALEQWSREHVLACADRQFNILESAKLALKPGGELVYSTCTFSPEENEGVIERFLKANPSFRVVESSESFGTKTAFGGVRIFPFQGGEGHFAVKLLKTEEYISLKNENPFEADLKDTKNTFIQKKNSRKKGKDLKERKKEGGIDVGEILDFYDSIFSGRPFGENIVQINDRIILLPSEVSKIPSLESCGVLRAGVLLGEAKKGRIEPAHCAFMAAKKEDCINAVDFSANQEELIRFLKGEETELCGNIKGYTCVCCEGMTTGFGKAVNSTLKNKYPKGLRLL